MKAYIHHRVYVCACTHTCLWQTWPHYSSRGYWGLCVSFICAERIIHKLSACKCTEWHKLNARNTRKEVLQPSLKCSSTTFPLAAASGRTRQKGAHVVSRALFLQGEFESGDSHLCLEVVVTWVNQVMGVTQRCLFLCELIMSIFFNPK